IYKNIKKKAYRVGRLPFINKYIRDRLINYRSGDFDVFHDVTNYGMAPGRSKAKKIITLHDIGTFRLPQFYRDYTIKRMSGIQKILKNTDAIITVSRFQKKEISEWFGFPDNRIFVVYHGVDTERFGKTEDERMINCEYIMYLGNLVPRKGVHYLLRAFALVKDKIPHDLLLAGVRGYSSDSIFAMINELGLKTRVIVRESPDDSEVINYLSYASVFVFPSLYEGFGMPPLEAMACGCPVIASDNTSLKELYTGSAILIDPEDADEFGNSILTLVNDEGLKKELVSKGNEKVREFPWDNTIKHTLKVYEKAMEN
ncbi:MAG TPA: glycosyltransferase family 1 protein, partial [Nitrospirae bacterium]|nr:glycosyltransferase family 1 protein [Nitrospirota bacterium]